MVDHFSDLTHVHLMRSTTQEDNLAVKTVFKILSAKFGVKIKIYHADNGIFSQQHYRSSIEDANPTIKYFGVVSHHQSAIFERNF